MRVRALPLATLLVIGTITVSSCSSTEPRSEAQNQAPATPQPSAVTSGTEPVSAPPSVVPAVPPDKALVTVYRKKRIVGLALHTSVYVDGVELAELENGAYVRLAVAPGPHALYADEERDTIKVDLEPGKEYFYRMELVPGVWKGNGILKPVDEATGAAEFREWKLKLTKEIRKPEMVVPDPGKP